MKLNELISILGRYVDALAADPADNNEYKIRAYKRNMYRIKKYYPNAGSNPMMDINVFKRSLNQFLTPSMLDKIVGIIRTGEFKKLQSLREKNKEKSVLLRKFISYPGIGKFLALKLINKGVKDLNSPKILPLLPKVTQDFIKLNPLKTIPRSLITKVHKELKKVYPRVYVVGSYARGLSGSDDIDVVVVEDQLELRSTPKLKFYPPYMKGVSKISTIAQFGGKHIKMDFFLTTPKELPFMLLYTVGSGDFNIAMRVHAGSLGYKLNEKGLFSSKTGKRVPGLATQKKIFKKLNLLYRQYPERTGADAIIILK